MGYRSETAFAAAPSDRDRYPLFYRFRLAVCVGDAQAGSLGCIAYRSRYLLREALHRCSCQCSRALPLSWELASALHKTVYLRHSKATYPCGVVLLF